MCRTLLAAGRLSATTDFSVVAELDTINICVPTPLRKTKDPDMSYIVSAVDAIAAHLHPGMLVVLESTTYPGTTEEVVQPLLERGGLKAGVDFFLAFSPERVDPGNSQLQHAQRAQGDRRHDAGVRGGGLRLLRHVNRDGRAGQFDSRGRDGEAARKHVPRGEYRPGERDRADVRQAGHQRLGSRGRREDQAVRLHAVLSRARASAGTAFPSTRSTSRGRPDGPASNRDSSSSPDTINGAMPHATVDKIVDALNVHKKALNGATVLVAGIAYKRDIDDMRESPALDVMGLLHQKGARVLYADPLVPKLAGRSWLGGFDLEAQTLDAETIAAGRLRGRSDRSQRLRLRRDRGRGAVEYRCCVLYLARLRIATAPPPQSRRSRTRCAR